MTEKFDPIFNRVLIKREVSGLSKKATKAGIIVPDIVGDKYHSTEGLLVKCGEDCQEKVKSLTGKMVLLAGYSGIDVTISGENFLLATDKDILGELK